jgi:hypothetical protein
MKHRAIKDLAHQADSITQAIDDAQTHEGKVKLTIALQLDEYQPYNIATFESKEMVCSMLSALMGRTTHEIRVIVSPDTPLPEGDR